MRDWDLLIGSGESLGGNGVQHLSALAQSGSGPLGWTSTLDRAGDDGVVTRQWQPPFHEVNEPSDVIPGNTTTTYSITLGGSETGVVNMAGDRDWFRVELVAGQSYVFAMTGSGGSPLEDPYLELHNSNGALIALDDDGGPGTPGVDLSSTLRFTATQSGTYYIVARAWEPDSGPSPTIVGGYTVTFNTGAPQDPLDTIDLGFTHSTNIAVYFATAGQTFQGDTAVRNWTQSEIDAAMAALATYAAVAPFTFTITTNSAAAQFILTLDNDIGANVLGHMGTVGSPGNYVSYGAFNPNGTGWTANGLLPGGAGFVTLIHEFGHGLGLAHPHDNGGVSEVMQGVTSPFGSYGTFLMNQGVFTTMSYNDGWDLNPIGGNVSVTSGSQSTPGAIDVGLIQQRYGVNTNFNNTATVYSLIAFTSQYRTIWDTGGIDTITFFGGTQNATIDLRAATLQNEIGGGGWVSYVSGFHMGFTIANGVVIENAIGGDGNDTITGNSAANSLTGNGGIDTISAGAGNDTIIGGTGNDIIDGGAGVDTSSYGVNASASSWARNIDGTWTVNAGAQGAETLTSVEYLDFSDRDVFLRPALQTFTGDGTSDMLFRRDDGLLVSWSVTGTTLNSANVIGVIGAEWTALGLGDLNGDNRADILWQRNDGFIYAWLMNGSTIASAGSVLTLGSEWDFLGLADLNGDLKDDLIWRNNVNGLVVGWQMDGATITSASIINGLGAEWSLDGFDDFNGDGRDDFLWRRDDGYSFVWLMNGNTISSAGATSAQTGTDWTVVGVGDTNGDGYADIIWERDDGLFVVWNMNGSNVISSGILTGIDPNEWTVLGVGDYNGDGRDDLLFQQNATGTVFAWILNGTTIEQAGAVASIGGEWSWI